LTDIFINKYLHLISEIKKDENSNNIIKFEDFNNVKISKMEGDEEKEYFDYVEKLKQQLKKKNKKKIK
jgi:hypothetical protein